MKRRILTMLLTLVVALTMTMGSVTVSWAGIDMSAIESSIKNALKSFCSTQSETWHTCRYHAFRGTGRRLVPCREGCDQGKDQQFDYEGAAFKCSEGSCEKRQYM